MDFKPITLDSIAKWWRHHDQIFHHIKGSNNHELTNHHMYGFQDPHFQMHHQWSYSVQGSSCHNLCGWQTFSCIMTISKSFMTPTRATWASISSSMVPIIHQVINDHIITFKGTRTIKPSNVGPRTSSRFRHQASGFHAHVKDHTRSSSS